MAGITDIRADPEINPDVGIPKPELNVVARPEENFVKPVSAERSALGQLAGSLKDFNPGLGKLEDRFKEIEQKQGEAQAAEAFAKDKGDWDQAVANHDIPSFLHPYGRMAARERFGRLAGDKMGGDIATDPTYIQANSVATTMEAHDQAYAAARQRWEDKNLGHASHGDPLFQAQYQAMAAEHTAQARARAVEQINKNYMGQTTEHMSVELATHTADLLDSHAAPEEITSQLQALADSYHGTVPEMLIRGSMGAAIDNLARERNDPTIYDLAKGLMVQDNNGVRRTMEFDPDFGKLRTAGKQEINRFEHTELQVANQQRAAVQAKARSDVADQIIQSTQDGKPPDLKAARAAYQAAGLGKFINEIGAIESAVRRQEPSQGHIVQSLAADIAANDDPYSGTFVGRGKLVAALREGQINTTDFRSLMSEISERDRRYKFGHDGRGQRIDPLTAADAIEKDWIARIKPTLITDDPHQDNFEREQSVNEVTQQMRHLMRAYVAAHSPLDPDKYDTYLEKLLTRLKTRYLGPKGEEIKPPPGGEAEAAMKTEETEAKAP